MFNSRDLLFIEFSMTGPARKSLQIDDSIYPQRVMAKSLISCKISYACQVSSMEKNQIFEWKITEVDNTCMKIVSLYIVAEYLLLRAGYVEK